MPFIGKSPWIVKPPRGIESTTNPKTIPYSKRGILVFKEKQDMTVHRDGAAR
jgi:hypothetical protein